MEENLNKTSEESKQVEKDKKKGYKIPKEFFRSMLFAYGGFIICLVSYVSIVSSFLFLLRFNYGISPFWYFIVIIGLFLVGSLCAFRRVKKNRTLYIRLGVFLLTIGLTNWGYLIYRSVRGGIIDTHYLSQRNKEKYEILMNEDEGYMYIGEVWGKNTEDEEKSASFYLFVKIVEGRRFYYCSKTLLSSKFVIQQCGNTQGYLDYGQKWIITFDFDWDNQYVSNKGLANQPPSQSTLAQLSSGNNNYVNFDEP